MQREEERRGKSVEYIVQGLFSSTCVDPDQQWVTHNPTVSQTERKRASSTSVLDAGQIKIHAVELPSSPPPLHLINPG